MSMINLSSAMPSNKNTNIAEYVKRLTEYTVLVRSDNTGAVLVDTTKENSETLKPKGLVVTGCAFSITDLTDLQPGPMPWAVVEVLSTGISNSVDFLEISYAEAGDALKHLENAGSRNIVGLARKDNLTFAEIERYIQELKTNKDYHVVAETTDQDHIVNYGIYCAVTNKQRGVVVHNSKYQHRNKIILSATDADGLAAAINYLK